jgi:hypothetical protein
MRKWFVLVVPGAAAVAVAATAVACWQPDKTAPGASHDVLAGGGIVEGSVMKSAYCKLKSSLPKKPASMARFRLSSIELECRMRERYLTVCSSKGETVGAGLEVRCSR